LIILSPLPKILFVYWSSGCSWSLSPIGICTYWFDYGLSISHSCSVGSS